MPRPKTEKSLDGRRLVSRQIYLKTGVAEDDLMIAVWEACLKVGRPQALFRDLLLEGYRARVERGLIPAVILDDPDVVRAMGAVGEMTARPTVVVVGGYGQNVPGQPQHPSAAPYAPYAPPSDPPSTTFSKDSLKRTNPAENAPKGLSRELM